VFVSPYSYHVILISSITEKDKNPSWKRSWKKKQVVERTEKLPVKRARMAAGPTPTLDVPATIAGDAGFKVRFPMLKKQQLFLDQLCNQKVIIEHPITLLDFSSDEFSFIPPIF
jgi:hypothetical protein